jgi:hypothetical protein
MIHSRPIAVIVTVGDQPARTTNLNDFLAANTELVDPMEAMAIYCLVRTGETYTGGGEGERPRFTIERAPLANASEPGSGRIGLAALPTGALLADPIYLHHASPLRAAVLAIAPCYRQADAAATIDACRYGPGRLPRVLCRLGGAWFPLSLKEARDEARHLIVNDGGPTDPAGELARHLAAALTTAADVLEAALLADQQGPVAEQAA